MRPIDKPVRDPEYAYRSLAIPAHAEEPGIRQLYRPFLLQDDIRSTDWVSHLELATVTKMAEEDLQTTGERVRVLVLYGSLRQR